MAKLTHEQYIYDVSEFPELNGVSRESLEFYNKTVSRIIFEFANDRKISALTKAYLNDKVRLTSFQRKILNNILNILKSKERYFENSQIRENFYVLHSFHLTTIGYNTLIKLGSVKQAKILDWEHIVDKLFDPNFDLKTSTLLEDWYVIGKELEIAFKKVKKANDLNK